MSVYPASTSSVSLKAESATARPLCGASRASWVRPRDTSNPTLGSHGASRGAGVMLW